MASKRDLAEAHTFNRRRLVTAFVSGSPGGREVEPSGYGRTLIGGLALAILLVAGAAIIGVLKPTVGKDWLKDTLVISKEKGSRSVATKGQIFPVLNTTSARLLLAGDSGKLKIEYAPEKEIAKQKQGPTIGIPGAPDNVPSTDLLVQTGWTSCISSDLGMTTRLDDDAGAEPVPGQAVAVRAENATTTYVISGNRRYAVPAGTVGDNILGSLGLDQLVTVRGAWLDLIPEGPGLKPFSVPGANTPKPTDVPQLNRVGMPVRVDGGDGYVLTRAGLLRLTPVAYDVYTSSPDTMDVVEIKGGDVAGIGSAPIDSTRPFPGDWPRDDITSFDGAQPCLLLTGSSADGPLRTAVLATPTNREAQASGERRVVQVQPGHGALVRATDAGSPSTNDTLFLISAGGVRFAVGAKDDTGTAKKALGYASIKNAAVPTPWTNLMRSGPLLSQQAVVASMTSQ
ncbi:type VII secretion protein EccB [Aeromicrobium sp.]|uniref:type VII secretion protein EccB n=1 Tax=Aeromicrobium sp. TaxID=1871063 RepID=UPI00198E4A5A|nr:type VII secretion protein EccB [Aeromicrobium sp.]MBC7630875.1 type VII secretion protein EccB [Aeromicrobium sp.]